ncbi:MAG: GAF and ANTAR domain-containing protein [Actinobacteria bacterium]|nr:GAF and ANTAR domain-containing protein [Actinomycetota bacterium]
MSGERSIRLAVAFARGMSRTPATGWCGVGVEFLVVSGVGITVMGGGAAGPLCVSDPSVAILEDAQFTVGEGPCPEAFLSGVPVSAASFGQETARRWPSFAPLAVANGMGAVFAYPLASAGANVGVLSVYQRSAGSLTDGQHADCLTLVEVITETMLSLQDTAPPGELARELDDAVAYRAEVYQASGIVAVQLGVPAAEALLRMRAHAFAADQTLDAVASAIVDRRLRLDEPAPGVPPPGFPPLGFPAPGFPTPGFPTPDGGGRS